MLELATWIRELCSSTSAIVHVPRPEDDPMVRQPDITLARSILGWEPSIAVLDGLQRTIDWFREHPENIHLRETGAEKLVNRP